MFLRGGAGEAGQRVPDAPGAPGPRPRRRPARHRLGRRRSRGSVPSVRPGPTCAPGTAALEPPAPPPRAFIRRRRKVPLGGVTPQRPRTFAEVPAAPGLGSRASPARALTRSPRMSAPPAGRPTPRSSSSDCRRGPWWGARASWRRAPVSGWRVPAADCHAAPRPAPCPCVGLQEDLVCANPGRGAWTGRDGRVLLAPPGLCPGVWLPSVRSLQGCALGPASDCCIFEGVGDGCPLWWCRDPAVAVSP